jgi:hypothetical protein
MTGRPLQRLRFIPGARNQVSLSSSVVKITGIAFGWIGSTTAFSTGRTPQMPVS